MRNLSGNKLIIGKLSTEFFSRWDDDICLVDPSKPIPLGVNWSNCIGICDTIDGADLLKISLRTGLRHIVQASSANLHNEIELAANMILKSEIFKENPTQNIFNLNGNPDSLDKMRFAFCNREQKEELGKSIANFLAKIPRGDAIRDSVILMASELFMNAMDAQERSEEGATDSQESELVIIKDESRLIIGVEDPYGGINPNKVITRILETYDRGISKSINLNEEKGGAGIGCRMMYDLAISFCIVVEPKIRTTVACILPLGQSLKAQALTGKNLHCLSIGGA